MDIILNFAARGRCDSDLLVIFKLLASVVNLIRIFVPVLLILFGTLDLANKKSYLCCGSLFSSNFSYFCYELRC